jgi:hypothetical protein
VSRRFAARLRRRSPKLKPRRRFLILCEGEVTEPAYFKSLRHEIRNRLIEVEIVPACGVPKTLVEFAVDRMKNAIRESRRLGDTFLKYDEVWCVFDVDSHPNLAEARQQARDNGLKIAISNPCFELWLLLHFQDQFSEQHRDEIRRICKQCLPDYKKLIPYEKIRGSYDDAVRRAVYLEQMHGRRGTTDGNPSTGVFQLTESLRKGSI